MKYIVPRLAIVLFILWSALTAAADNERFQVEVIVFAQDDPWEEERPHRDAHLAFPADLRVIEPADSLSRTPTESGSLDEKLVALMIPETSLTREAAQGDRPFRALGEEQRRLDPEAFTLGRSGHYRVLFHKAWRQPVPERREAPWVRVAGGHSLTEGVPEMAGALRIYQGRYLHIQTDLWRVAETATTTANGTDSEAPTDDRQNAIILPYLPQPSPSAQWQRLQQIGNKRRASVPVQTDSDTLRKPITVAAVDLLRQSERLREDRLQYLDHPRLGVLVLVTPVDNDGDDTEGGEEESQPR